MLLLLGGGGVGTLWVWGPCRGFSTRGKNRRTNETRIGEPRPLEWTLSWTLPWTSSPCVLDFLALFFETISLLFSASFLSFESFLPKIFRASAKRINSAQTRCIVKGVVVLSLPVLLFLGLFDRNQGTTSKTSRILLTLQLGTLKIPAKYSPPDKHYPINSKN